MRLGIFLIGAVVVCGSYGCGSPDCSKDSFKGLYLAHYTERSGGTCGALPDAVLDSSAQGEGCTTKSNSYSDDECTQSIVMECPESGYIGKMTGTIDQLDSDGNEYKGLVTLQMRNASTGVISCVSTYDIKYTRQ